MDIRPSMYTDIVNVDPSDLKGTVDVSAMMEKNNLTELKAGTYSADVVWTLPEGVIEKGTVSVYVTVQEK